MATTLMTPEEHKEIFQAISESVVAEPDAPTVKEEDLLPVHVDPRALRGALHLDEHHPGWADKINLRTFDISCASSCVVGQLGGDYGAHASKLFPGVGNGLGTRAEDFGIMPNGNGTQLNCSWQILIAERQTKREVTTS